VPVSYILSQAGSKMGLNPNAASSRATLLRFLNEAAVELYNQSDPPGSLMEQVFKVNGDQTISCPSYVGPIRGVREVDSQITWSINQLRPRYNQFNWPDSWRNLRLKNVQALAATVTNASVGVLTVGAVENPPIQVTVTGPTTTASSVSETITMDAISKQTANTYTDYTSVKKNTVNNYDVTLSDIDGKLLTVIPNNQLAAQYQIIDVSICPWLAVSTNTLEHYVEILFKLQITQLSNNSDEFIWGQKYDNILVNKMLQLWYEEQGKPELASAYDSKATRSLARMTEDQNRATEDMIAVVAHPHDVLLPRVRAGRKKYYRGYGSRGYGY
jgi:hypothetical protein